MASPDETIRNRFLPTNKTEAAAPSYAGRKSKRPLTLAVYDPEAAEELAAAASLLSLSDRAGALVPSLARPPVDAVPLSFAAPRAEPPWLRQRLGLRLDLAVHFVGEKAVTVTDLDGQQNRFRLPTEPVLRVLRSILFDEELDAAKIPHAGMEVAPGAPKKPQPQPIKEEPLQGNRKIVKTTNRKQGAKHGGLPVSLCNVDAGVMDLRLTRWESTHVVVVKGEGYLDLQGERRRRDLGLQGAPVSLLRPMVSSRKTALRCACQERTAAGAVARDGEVHDTLDSFFSFSPIVFLAFGFSQDCELQNFEKFNWV